MPEPAAKLLTSIPTFADMIEAERPQWVAWNMESRKPGGKPTKVPKNPNTGGNAMADTPSTWGAFDAALKMAEVCDFSGVGYEFSVDDEYAGVDLDNCRDRETGEIRPWARTIIDKLGSGCRHHWRRPRCERGMSIGW